jgi:hypothetical protein
MPGSADKTLERNSKLAGEILNEKWTTAGWSCIAPGFCGSMAAILMWSPLLQSKPSSTSTSTSIKAMTTPLCRLAPVMMSASFICVLYSPPLCPVGLRLDFTGPSQFQWTLLDSLLDFRWTLMDSAMFRYKSSQSLVKWLNGKKWLDWLDLSVHWTSTGLICKKDRLGNTFAISVFSGSSWHNQGSIIFRNNLEVPRNWTKII